MYILMALKDCFRSPCRVTISGAIHAPVPRTFCPPSIRGTVGATESRLPGRLPAPPPASPDLVSRSQTSIVVRSD